MAASRHFTCGLLLAAAAMCWVAPRKAFALLTAAKLRGADLIEPPIEACTEFALGAVHLSWTLEECMEIWATWADTIPDWLNLDYPDRSLMKEVAAKMRDRGQPCVVQTRVRADGVGSEVTRHLAAWLYAVEIGCDWVTPNFGYEDEAEDGPEGGTLYCHPSAAAEEFDDIPEGVVIEQNLESCELVNWLKFFRFDAPSVPEPEAAFRNVTVRKPLW